MLSRKILQCPMKYDVEVCDICGKEIARYQATNGEGRRHPYNERKPIYGKRISIAIWNSIVGERNEININSKYDLCEECFRTLQQLMKSSITDTMNKVFDDFIEANKKEESDD